MDDKRIEQLRTLLMFVMAWLVAVYVFDVAQKAFQNNWVSVTMAIGTMGINWFARKKASAYAVDKAAFKFWLYLPMAVFLVVPFLVKMIEYYRSGDERSWFTYVAALLPFLLKLGIPMAVLLWIYLCLGWIKADPPEVEEMKIE